MTNGLVPPEPRTERDAIGVEEPMPSLSLVLSKKKLALSCVSSPPVPINAIEPCVSPVRYKLPEVVRLVVEAKK